MTPPTCNDTRPLLMAYLDSELDPTTTLGLSEHLSSCASCRSRLEAEQAIEAGFGQALRAERMPRDVAQRLDAALAAVAAEVRPAGRSRPLFMRVSGWAAAALVLLALGLWVQDGGTARRPTVSPLSSVFVSAYDQYAATPPSTVDLGAGGLAGLLADPTYAGLHLPSDGFAGPDDHRHPIRYLGARSTRVEGVDAVNLAYDCCGAITSVLVVPVAGLPLELLGQVPLGATLDLELDGGLKARAVRSEGFLVGVSSRHSVVLADEISS